MVQTIRDAIKSGDEITVRILNYKRNGAPFWNMFTLAPMKDSDGTIRFLVGVQVGAALVPIGTWRHLAFRLVGSAQQRRMACFMLPNRIGCCECLCQCA